MVWVDSTPDQLTFILLLSRFPSSSVAIGVEFAIVVAWGANSEWKAQNRLAPALKTGGMTQWTLRVRACSNRWISMVARDALAKSIYLIDFESLNVRAIAGVSLSVSLHGLLGRQLACRSSPVGSHRTK